MIQFAAVLSYCVALALFSPIVSAAADGSPSDGAVGVSDNSRDDGVTAEMLAAELAVGKVLFNRKCAKCHTAEDTFNDIGPTLHGVVGRSAGTVAEFDYSSSIRGSGLIWTEANLMKYINDPNAFVPCKKIQIRSLSMCPGIHMKFEGFRNPYAARAVVSYLKSQAPEAASPSSHDRQ